MQRNRPPPPLWFTLNRVWVENSAVLRCTLIISPPGFHCCWPRAARRWSAALCTHHYFCRRQSSCSRNASLISTVAHNDDQIEISLGLRIRAMWVMQNVLTFLVQWCSSLPRIPLSDWCNRIPLFSQREASLHHAVWSNLNVWFFILCFCTSISCTLSQRLNSEIRQRGQWYRRTFFFSSSSLYLFDFMASVGYEIMLWISEVHQRMPTHAVC